MNTSPLRFHLKKKKKSYKTSCQTDQEIQPFIPCLSSQQALISSAAEIAGPKLQGAETFQQVSWLQPALKRKHMSQAFEINAFIKTQDKISTKVQCCCAELEGKLVVWVRVKVHWACVHRVLLYPTWLCIFSGLTKLKVYLHPTKCVIPLPQF